MGFNLGFKGLISLKCASSVYTCYMDALPLCGTPKRFDMLIVEYCFSNGGMCFIGGTLQLAGWDLGVENMDFD